MLRSGKAENKYCILTLDTEGDNLWGIRNSDFSISRITNRNGEYLERFQLLAEKYGLKPTYLVNYEMSLSLPFREMVERHKADLEVGMHMHAFNSPPYYKLPDRYGGNKAYIGEYPREIQMRKVDYLTKQLEDVFQTEIKSHRGGRWYIDSTYIGILQQYNYLVDCTVTPGIDWTGNAGQTEGSHGIDFRKAPAGIYYMSEQNVCKAGHARGMLEVPVSLVKKRQKDKSKLLKMDLWNREGSHGEYIWLRPTGSNLKEMKELVELKAKKNEYLEFMIHSSELMPGGSPTFQSEDSITSLYKALEELFCFIRNKGYWGKTITAYAKMRVMDN